MNDPITPFLFGFFIALIASTLVTRDVLNQKWTKEAHERGYLVQCVGKTGWHWECEP